MHSLQNIDVARQLAREHEALLRAGTPLPHASHGRSVVRRWLGRQLVRTRFWLAYERPIRAAAAR